MPVMQDTSDCLCFGGSQIKHLQHSRPVWDMSLAEGVNKQYFDQCFHAVMTIISHNDNKW